MGVVGTATAREAGNRRTGKGPGSSRWLDYAAARGLAAGRQPGALAGAAGEPAAGAGEGPGGERHAALDWRKVGGFMLALPPDGRALPPGRSELVILTACRSGEVRGARWTEIDRQARTWTLPAERTKAAKEHRVPLTDAALAVLDQMAKLGDERGPDLPGRARVGVACERRGAVEDRQALRAGGGDHAARR